MSKRRSKKESKAAQRAAAGGVNLDKKQGLDLDKKGAGTQERGTVGGATRAKVPAGAARLKVDTPTGPVRALTFGHQTYMFTGIGFALVMIGLLMMSGGRGTDYSEFNVDEIYSFTKITLAPVLILSGIGVVIYGLFKK